LDRVTRSRRRHADREEHAQLIEALPKDEFDDEHLPGAINIPLKTLDAD
jgi:rhodanese-related sulfurtransferase